MEPALQVRHSPKQAGPRGAADERSPELRTGGFVVNLLGIGCDNLAISST